MVWNEAMKGESNDDQIYSLAISTLQKDASNAFTEVYSTYNNTSRKL